MTSNAAVPLRLSASREALIVTVCGWFQLVESKTSWVSEDESVASPPDCFEMDTVTGEYGRLARLTVKVFDWPSRIESVLFETTRFGIDVQRLRRKSLRENVDSCCPA